MAEISVVIPVYNSERRLPRMLKSLKAQTFKDFELILVDDCSTDNSLEVMERCSGWFDNCRIISLTQNIGCYAARLYGIRESTGNFMYSVDADDYTMPDALKQLYTRQQETEADIVCMGMLARINLIPRSMRFYTPPTGIYDRRQMLYGLIANGDVSFSFCNKLFRRNLISSLPDLEDKLFLGEDTFASLHLYNCAKKMAFVPYYGYVYYQYGGSHRWQSNRWRDNIMLFKLMQDRIPELDIPASDRQRLAREYSLVFCNTFVHGVAQKLFLRNTPRKRVQRYIEECLDEQVWTDLRNLVGTDDNANYNAIISRDVEAIMRNARQLNRQNFKNELISYLSTWKCPW